MRSPAGVFLLLIVAFLATWVVLAASATPPPSRLAKFLHLVDLFPSLRGQDSPPFLLQV